MQFIPVRIPREQQAAYRADGGLFIRAFLCDTEADRFRVFIAVEPVEPNKPEWHVSISRDTDRTRPPTDAELMLIAKALVPKAAWAIDDSGLRTSNRNRKQRKHWVRGQRRKTR